MFADPGGSDASSNRERSPEPWGPWRQVEQGTDGPECAASSGWLSENLFTSYKRQDPFRNHAGCLNPRLGYFQNLTRRLDSLVSLRLWQEFYWTGHTQTFRIPLEQRLEPLPPVRRDV